LVTAATVDSRHRILDGALRCFDRRGVLATTLEDIRRASAASIGSIYHHFADKEGLATAVYLDGMRRYQEGFLRELDGQPDAEPGVKAIVAFHLRWCAANPELARFLLSRPARSPELEDGLRTLNRPFFAEVMAWWQPHARAGRLRQAPVELLYALWLGPAQEHCRHWLAGRVRRSPAQAAALLAEAAWLSLQRPKGQP
jgi:AcrR family transcriptional regulator